MWRDITSSSDGTKLAAVEYYGIWTSSDSGGTWNEVVATPYSDGSTTRWISITSSSDGTKLAA
eukprot:856822-Prymnesium_polylepis.1